MPPHVDDFSGDAGRVSRTDERDGGGPGGPGALPDGAQVGRYALEAVIGDGRRALYLARDTTLDRSVILELFHVRGEAAARLLREARLLAGLAHPNVVTVLDVGEHDGAVYIAFDRLAGQSVAGWIASGERSVEDIRRVFRDAALGLAAAHEAGLVHGDLAGDSVLVDRDGRVRVTFGAGGRLGAALPAFHGAAEGSVDGARFPAPELGRGEPPTPASDQFSLAAILRDAVQRARGRVEGGARLRRLRLAVGRLRVPGRVARAVDRALAAEPGQRWPSMAALAGALDLPHRRIGALAVAAITLVALSGGALALSLAAGDGDEDRCGWVEGAMAGVWDGAARTRVLRALTAAGDAPVVRPSPGGGPVGAVGQSTARALDRYAEGWIRQRRALCRVPPEDEAAARRAAQTGACLARRREGLSALVAELSRAAADRLQHAASAAASLPPVEECAHGQLVVAPGAPPPPPVRSRLDALGDELDRLRARQALGDAGVAARAREIAAEATRLGDPALASRWWMTVALAGSETTEPTARLEPLHEALWAAESAGDLIAALTAWIRLVEIGAAASLPRDEVERMLAHAAATLTRIERIDPSVADRHRAPLLAARAEILDEYGSPAEAEEVAREVIAILTRLSGGESTLEIAAAEHELGQILIGAARFDEAIEVGQRALERTRALVGDDHPQMMSRHYQLGWASFMRGRHDAALAEVAESRRIATRIGARLYLGKLAILEAQIEQKRGRPEEARAALQRAIADGSAAALSSFQIDYYLGEIEVNLGDFAAAEASFRRALDAIVAVNPGDPDVSFARAGIAMSLVSRRRFAEARPLLEAAVADMEKHGQSERPLAVMRRMLAEALWETGERRRARAVAEEVRAFLAGLPADMAAGELADVEAWLAAHGEAAAADAGPSSGKAARGAAGGGKSKGGAGARGKPRRPRR